MNKFRFIGRATALAIGVSLIAFSSFGQEAKKKDAKPDFEIAASYIEACSCDMFCPCYFNTHSTHHGNDHYCRANLVLKVDKGHYKNTKLDGAKVWIPPDLGTDWSTGNNSWAVWNSDPTVTAEQNTTL